MPSGTGRGSSGSHSGGSRSSGGSHFSSSSNRSSFRSHHGHHHSMVVTWNNRHYELPPKVSGIFGVLTFILFIIIAVLITSIASILPDQNRRIDKIQSDYIYYQNMITFAESQPGYIRDATIVRMNYNFDCKKWYLEYEIKTDLGDTLRGYTYSMYTFDDLKEFRAGQTIKCAVNTNPVTLNTDSINLDYKNTSLSDDGEYVTAQALKQGWTTATIILTLSAVAMIIIMSIIVKKSIKNTHETESNTINIHVFVCPYCGTKNTNNERNCPNCGAKFKKND